MNFGPIKPAVVLAVDEHPLIRSALREVLRLVADPVELLEASSAEEGLDVLALRDDIDLVVLEPKFSQDGLSAVSRFHLAAPRMPLIVYTMCEDAPVLKEALAQGAAGVVPKTHSAALLRKAIEIVMEGGMYLPPQLAWPLIRTEPAARKPAAPSISPQQSRILELLEQGLPNKAIARKLGIACSTVRNQLTLVFRQLGVANRTQAVIVTRALAKSSRDFTP
jgi:DNA-binding NarL/FixJ family response regulator